MPGVSLGCAGGFTAFSIYEGVLSGAGLLISSSHGGPRHQTHEALRASIGQDKVRGGQEAQAGTEEGAGLAEKPGALAETTYFRRRAHNEGMDLSCGTGKHFPVPCRP